MKIQGFQSFQKAKGLACFLDPVFHYFQIEGRFTEIGSTGAELFHFEKIVF